MAILTACSERYGPCHVQQKLADVLDYDDNPLLEVRSEVVETIRPLLV